MNQRDHEVRVRVSDAELARLDEHRGSLSRAGYVRSLLREPPSGEIATMQEVLLMLSEQARAGKVAAAIALERALRNAPPELDDTFEDELERLFGR